MILQIIICSLITINIHSIEKKPELIAKEISIPCDRNGYPKKNTLKALVAAMFINNKQNISIKTIRGGYYSEKMYVVMRKKNGQKIPLFFLKISKKSDSTNNLLKIQTSNIGQKLQKIDAMPKRSATTISEKIPAVILLHNVFSYTSHNKEKKYIEVTKSAKGQIIRDILESHNKDMIQKTAFELGKNLASFQKLFMNYNDSSNASDWTTVSHGDFSIRNTLFDLETKTISFIDNETMHTGQVSQDIKTALTSFVMFKYLQRHFRTRWPLYLQYCLSFLKGYIESFPEHQRADLAVHIEYALTESLHKGIQKGFIHHDQAGKKDFNIKMFKKVIHTYLQTFYQ